MHNIFSTTGVTSNQGKQLVKSGRLGSKDKVHNGVKKSEMGRKGLKNLVLLFIDYPKYLVKTHVHKA